MTQIRYLEWRWDEDTVIEYRRAGECNGCGMCCMVRIEWLLPRRSEPEFTPEHILGVHGWNPRNGSLVPLRIGIETEVIVDGRRRYFSNITIGKEPDVCSMLTADKRCKIHAGKALIASAWPMSPAQVEALPECSYTFEEIGRWKISELESDK